jgi:hypothetical protein
MYYKVNNQYCICVYIDTWVIKTIGYRLDSQISNPIIYLGQFPNYHFQYMFEVMHVLSGGYRVRFRRQRSDWTVVITTQIRVVQLL